MASPGDPETRKAPRSDGTLGPDRWRELSALLDEALDLPTAEREACNRLLTALQAGDADP